MNNFETIDDYLSNKLSEADRKSFDLQMEGDPSLKAEVDLQRQIVEGVQRARAAELKTMLQNVPVTGAGWSTGKAAVTIIAAGLIGSSLYLYLQEDPKTETNTIQSPSVTTEQPANSEPTKDEPVVTEEKKDVEEKATSNPEQKTEKRKAAEIKTAEPVKKPDIQVVDPSEELVQTDNPEPVKPATRPEVTPSKMEVAVNPNDKKYNFHYQFVQGKLMLYGPFDKTLYEVLEINSDSHAVFLFYRENYYLLDEGQQKVTALSAIRDAQLLKKLKEYRGR